MNFFKLLLPAFAALTISLSTAAQTVKPFQKGDRVTFVGNSITDGGHYHSYIWLYYMTHFPQMRLWMANCGVGGDTAKDILARLDDDVLKRNPTVLTFTFGMNDTGYYEYNGGDSVQFGNKKVAEARENFLKAEKRLQSLQGVRCVMIGTSPYDQTSRFNNDIFKNKNNYIQRVIAFQDSAARANHWEFVDFNEPMVRINQREQQADSTFTLIGSDRIHPDNNGHMVMAYLFLKAQGMVGQKVADVQIDAASRSVKCHTNCKVNGLRQNGGTLQFQYLANSLPLPLDTVPHGWGFTHGAAEVTRDIPTFLTDLSDEHLTVQGLSTGSYQLCIDTVVIDTLSSQALSQGINLATYRHTPQYQQALTIMALNEARWELERKGREWAWVNYDFMMPAGYLNDASEQAAQKYRQLASGNAWLLSKKDTYDKMRQPQVRQANDKQQDYLVDEIYRLNKPQKHLITLKKL